MAKIYLYKVIAKVDVDIEDISVTLQSPLVHILLFIFFYHCVQNALIVYAAQKINLT